MSHRRPEQSPPHLENVLRTALRLAVDSVEPAADGLDRIRAKISTRQRASRVRWRLAAVAPQLESLRRLTGPAGHWLNQAGHVVATRFRPDSGRADRLGWLRPVAAVATGLFVVASASWAIAALPSVMARSSGNTRSTQGTGGSGGGGGGGQSTSQAPTSGVSGFSTGPGGIAPNSSGPASSSCASPSSLPSTSPSGSPSTSPSTSPSPTPTSTSPSTSPSPSPSPSPATSSASPSTSSSPPQQTQSPDTSSATAQATLAARVSKRATNTSASPPRKHPTSPPCQ